MGFFQNFVAGLAGSLEVKTICSGADVLIVRHTNINLGSIDKRLRNHADEIIKNYVINDSDRSFNEASAALLKLAIIFKNYEQRGDVKAMEVMASCMALVRENLGQSIRNDISLYVLGETGN